MRTDDEASSPPRSDADPHADAAAASSEAKGGLRELLRIAIPTALANLAEYLPVSVALYFIGRRGDADDLDAVGLGRSYFNISCFSTSYGLISALRTLCPRPPARGKGKNCTASTRSGRSSSSPSPPLSVSSASTSPMQF